MSVSNLRLNGTKITRKVSAVIEGPFAFAQIYELFTKHKYPCNLSLTQKGRKIRARTQHILVSPKGRSPSASGCIWARSECRSADVNEEERQNVITRILRPVPKAQPVHSSITAARSKRSGCSIAALRSRCSRLASVQYSRFKGSRTVSRGGTSTFWKISKRRNNR